ncbi:MAG: cyclase family protein [Acidimicrobiales bacterium]
MSDFRELGESLRNWGRWGPEDQKGTVNHITPERLVAAAKLVRTGQIFDLGIPLDSDGPQPPGAMRINPVHLMRVTGQGQDNPGGFHWADDYIFMPLQAGSQWDALSHVYYDDLLYNGYPATEVNDLGAFRNSIDQLAKGIAGRGVLLDIARLRGVDWLENGHVIGPDELDEAAATQGVEVLPGDILLIRTGWRRKFVQERDPHAFFYPGEPGIGIATCAWLHAKEVAAVGSDNWAVEVVPVEGSDSLPVHLVLIRDMGMTLGEILDFEELSESCASDGVWEFFFAGPPLKFTRAVGSPINPLAIK